MDRLNDMKHSATGMQNVIEGLHFPISKNDAVNELKQHGAPDKLVEAIRSANLDQFKNAQELKSKLPNLNL
jgi:hypothetical protein